MTEKTTAYVQYLFLTQCCECVPQNRIKIIDDVMVEVDADNGLFVFAIGDDDRIHELDSLDYDHIVEETADYVGTVLGAVEKTGNSVGAWKSVEQYIVELLNDYELPVELTSKIMHHAIEKHEDNREIDLANNVSFAEIYG